MDVRLPVTEKCPGSNPGVPAISCPGPSSSGRIPGCEPGEGGSTPPGPSKSDGWTCNHCGACCSLVDCPHYLQTHWADGGGVCGIYETRPAECRVPEVLKQGAPGIVEFYCETCRFLAEQRKRWHNGR